MIIEKSKMIESILQVVCDNRNHIGLVGKISYNLYGYRKVANNINIYYGGKISFSASYRYSFDEHYRTDLYGLDEEFIRAIWHEIRLERYV